MIGLAREHRGVPRRPSTPFIKGEPDAILLVEFAGDERDAQVAS